MVKHRVFGVERDIDIPKDVFPTEAEIETMESFLPECEHGWFDSVHEGLKLHYRKFVPPTKNKDEPKGIVVWMHGIQTHSGRACILDNGKRKLNMALTAHACVEQGLALYAFDMIGHGYSEGLRFHIPSYEIIRDDYIHFVKLVASFHEQQPKQQRQQEEKKEDEDEDEEEKVIPTFLMGESFGGNMTLHVAKHFQLHPAEAPIGLDSVILLSAGIYRPPMTAHVMVGLRYIAVPIGGKWRFPDFFPNPVTPDVIWREPEIVALYAKEKRVGEMLLEPAYRHCKFGTLQSLFNGMVVSRGEIIPGFKVPFCVAHGTEDRAQIMEECLDYLLEYTSTPKQDVAHLRIPGAYHDLLADPESEKVIGFVMDWIRQRSTGPPTKWIDRDFTVTREELEKTKNDIRVKRSPEKKMIVLIMNTFITFMWITFIFTMLHLLYAIKELVFYGNFELYNMFPILMISGTIIICHKS